MSDEITSKEAFESVTKILKMFKGFEHLQKILESRFLDEQYIAEKQAKEFQIRIDVEALSHKKKVLEEEISELEKCPQRYDEILAQTIQAQTRLTEIENRIVERSGFASSLEEKILQAQAKFKKLSELAGQV